MTTIVNTLPTHHPSEAMLLDCAAGAAAAPFELLIASHLAMCPLCAGEVALLERVGGVMLDDLAPEPINDESLAAVMARLEQPEPAPQVADQGKSKADFSLPPPLSRIIDGPVDQLPWKRRGGIREIELLINEEGYRSRLYWIDAGTTIPAHTHGGTEMTLVLRGAFHDRNAVYRAGDVAEADGEVDHSPITDGDEDCLCLAVTDAPLRLTGRFSRLLNPFIRI